MFDLEDDKKKKKDTSQHLQVPYRHKHFSKEKFMIVALKFLNKSFSKIATTALKLRYCRKSF